MAPLLILDGGLGTTLEREHGVVFTSSDTPLWSSSLLVTDPDTLAACQKSFGDVPADIILTATYQVSPEGFQSTRSANFPDGVPRHQISQFLERAVKIAENAAVTAAGNGGAVALSLGPYGACMIPSQEYSGRYDAEHSSEGSLEKWHAERLALFSNVTDLSSRLSYIALETIPRVDEIVAMRKSLSALPVLRGVPFWTSCLFPGDGCRLPDGSSAESVVKAMLDPSLAEAVPWAVGINCTKVGKLDSLVKSYEAGVDSMVSVGSVREWPALVLYPDGTNGQVYDTVTQTWRIPEGSPQDTQESWEDQLAAVVKGTQTRGKWSAIVVGGCCMAAPGDIKRLRQKLREE